MREPNFPQKMSIRMLLVVGFAKLHVAKQWEGLAD
jgi:hypothetical protein